MQVRSDYGNTNEVGIDAFKFHWSELGIYISNKEDENITTNEEIFKNLRKKWSVFFYDHGDELMVREKIVEGGQVEIINAEAIDRSRKKRV